MECADKHHRQRYQVRQGVRCQYYVHSMCERVPEISKPSGAGTRQLINGSTTPPPPPATVDGEIV